MHSITRVDGVKYMALGLLSPEFENNGNIPDKYTCKGEDKSPPLQIKDVPVNTESLALVMDDPDAPVGTFVHWVAWNIEPVDEIAEDREPGVLGTNDFGRLGYGGPCPPSGTHRYFFKLYALKKRLSIPEGSSKEELEEAIADCTIEKAELVGLYSK